MLLGVVLGWAVLAPLSKEQRWAPGPISDWETGAKGWLLWISLSIMLAESLVSFVLLIGTTAWKAYNQHVQKNASNDEDADPAPPNQLVPQSWWVTGLILSSIFCVIVVTPLCNLPIYQPAVAVVIALLVSILAVRALGETDLNPASGVGKLSQIAFGVIAPGNAVANVIAGAIAEAGAAQAGDLMQDLKAGHILRASPRAQFYGQLIGTFFSTFFAVAAFILYSTAYSVPSNQFPVPTAHIWLDMAKMMTGNAKKVDVVWACVIAALFAGAGPILQQVLGPSRANYVPSGIAVALGMYLTPNWNIPRIIGALGQAVWMLRSPDSYTKYMVVAASGLILGEGVLSIFTALLKTAGVPPLSCIACPANFCEGC